MRGRMTRWGAGLMRLGLTALMLCAMATASGCLNFESDRPRTWIDNFWSFDGPTGSDVISVEVALLEQPLADPYLNSEVWQSLDEQTLSIERNALLRENGLRVGLVGGIVPPELQALLTSEGSNPSPRRFRLHSGVSTEVPLTPIFEQLHIDWQLKLDELEEYEAKNAELLLRITPELLDGEKVRLICVPVVRHGDRHIWRSPEDGGGLSLDGVQAEKVLDELSWQVDLRPNEYAAVGTDFRKNGTLGARALIVSQSGNLIQRLLVLRASPTARPVPQPEPLSADDAPGSPQGGVPLALQAHYGFSPSPRID